MKTYWDLTNKQQSTAINRAIQLAVSMVVEGVIELEMRNPVTQEILNKTLTNSRKLEDPKIVETLLLTHPSFKPEIYRIAIAAAEGSNYSDDGNLLKEVM